MGEIRGMEQFFTAVKTSRELNHLGKTPATITRACQQGELLRLMRNAYIPAGTWNSWKPKQQCIGWHVAFLKTHRQYVLSHVSAALWWGAPLLKLPQKIWVSHPSPTARTRGVARVSRGRAQECSQAILHRGTHVTTPLQTAVDCAMTLPVLDALCIIDYLLNQRLVTLAELGGTLGQLSGRGARTAREVARFMSDKSESPAETIARYRMMCWGFVMPQEQVSIWAGAGMYRPDFVWENLKIILEVDGLVKYDGTHGDPVRVIQQEKRRQRDLEQLGYRVIRVQWEDVMKRPHHLRSLLLGAGVPLKDASR